MFAYPIDEDLALELLAPHHAESLFALIDANRRHLRRWHPWVDATRTVDDSRAFIESTRRQYADNGVFQTAIRQHSMLVGIVGFNQIDHANRWATLGYWLAASAQGQGIVTRACRSYIAHAFSMLGLHRIEIRCASTNDRSRGVPERLGFTLEGVLRDREWLYDRFVDHAVYGLHAADG
ncbi:GNAT family protein [Salinisphaera sp. SPP-AMP-43]|uniref:GNAT family N-acetyltransferase n=1 Tax=Salinisphaera sp. SPP-AMP-43 TaxID=3121288 RepID=UPI003C6E2FE1